MKNPEEIVTTMLSQDAFSQFLGIKICEIDSGYCSLTMEIKKEFTNGFGISHGGITFSLADSTLAFASNSRGNQCVSIDTSITHLARVQTGDILTSFSKEIHFGKQIAVYEVDIYNQNKKRVAHFKGTVKVSENCW